MSKHGTFSYSFNRLQKYSKLCIFLTTKLFSKFLIIINIKQYDINEDHCCTIVFSMRTIVSPSDVPTGNTLEFPEGLSTLMPSYFRSGEPTVPQRMSPPIMLSFNPSKVPSLIHSESNSVIPSRLHSSLHSLVPNVVSSGTKLFTKFGRISNTNHCAVNEANCCTIICSNLKYFRVSIRVVYPYAFTFSLSRTQNTSNRITFNNIILQYK